ncbi:MAG TPA: GyrI-like domain-containing protein [Candidatus Limnocylindrales bacterium]|nr:GyrI-like domain-containing protein [Candidatus Limnocylindrales bacterium]
MKFSKSFLLILGLALLANLATAQTKTPAPAAKPKMVHQDEFYIVGIEARTSAEKEMSGQGVIGLQWQKFMQEGVLQKIPNKADQNVYAVYTDFANKRAGEYSIVIGARVTDKSKVPEGLVLKTIPAGNYAIFPTEKGPAWEVIPAAWQRIAEAEDKGELGSTRTYQADYEVYDGQAMDAYSWQAEIHVGVK